MNNLTVNFAAVSYIEYPYEFILVADRIDYSIISGTQAVIRGIAQFLASKWAGVIFQRREFRRNSVLQGYREFPELIFSTWNYFDFIDHCARCALCNSWRKLLRPREVSLLRVSAMAKSIISSLNRALCISPDIIAFCSGLGSEWNAVKKTSAFAWIVVIVGSPFIYVNLLQNIAFVKLYSYSLMLRLL
ncbi:MAG: hypothetical protein V1670_02950 [Candidatus Omnitrophota bacterium]